MTNTSLTPSTPHLGKCLPLLAAGAIASLLTGCATEPESHVVSAPPPGVATATATPAPTVYTAPAATSGTNMIVVTQTPPAPQQEVVSARPSADHVWVGGYWTWRSNRYEWVAGHWVVPPQPGVTWIPPRWEPEGGAYRFYEGYWE